MLRGGALVSYIGVIHPIKFLLTFRLLLRQFAPYCRITNFLILRNKPSDEIGAAGMWFFLTPHGSRDIPAPGEAGADGEGSGE